MRRRFAGTSLGHHPAVRYAVLATDFDGTLAHDGIVAPATWHAVDGVAASGRKVVLVTGRLLQDLLPLLDRPQRFALIVCENGAVVYDPAKRSERTIVEPPPEAFVAELRKRGVTPLEVGKVIVSTWEPHEQQVLDVIRDLGLEWHVVFNKGAVMALPSGITKASGLQDALDELLASHHNLVAIGDGENDGVMLSFAECGIAVANAIPMLKEHADMVTAGDHGDGVREIIEALIAEDLAMLSAPLRRHAITLGETQTGEDVRIGAADRGVLVMGTSGGGKSTLTLSFVERLVEAGYQFCIVDAEGDYESFQDAIVLGDADAVPQPEEVRETLRAPRHNVVVNLLAVAPEERPAYFSQLAQIVASMRAERGRPHWLIVDEAHHVLPADADVALEIPLSPVLIVTTKANLVQPVRLRDADVAVAFGTDAPQRLAEVLSILGASMPPQRVAAPQGERALFWSARDAVVREFHPAGARTMRVRHRRKYATGELTDAKSFFFRGPENRMNLRAQNLMTFVHLARGIDDETWMHHLRGHDYSRWFSERIGDEALARDARAAEDDPQSAAASTRQRIIEAVLERYTAPA